MSLSLPEEEEESLLPHTLPLRQFVSDFPGMKEAFLPTLCHVLNL